MSLLLRSANGPPNTASRRAGLERTRSNGLSAPHVHAVAVRARCAVDGDSDAHSGGRDRTRPRRLCRRARGRDTRRGAPTAWRGHL